MEENPMLRTRWFGALALLALASCGESKEWKNVKTQASETWDAVKSWGVAKRGEAEVFFSKSVDDLSESIEVAKANARAAGGDAVAALESKWRDVSVKLAELKAASADKWDQAREAFVKAYESVKREVSSGP
jgi:hypothetical protein